MFHPPESTLFLGKKLHYLPSVDSTNKFLHRLLREKGKLIDGELAIASYQSEGRGQRGSKWDSQADQNLTFSFVLNPPLPNERFWVGAAVALALKGAIEAICGKQALLKWPNDIYVENKKIAGILQELLFKGSQLQAVILGVGLNVNQESFPYPSATSVALLTCKVFQLNLVFQELIPFLEKEIMTLRQDVQITKSRYTQAMYQYNETASYEDKDGRFQGVILGVDHTGKLALDKGGQILYYDLKEIRFC